MGSLLSGIRKEIIMTSIRAIRDNKSSSGKNEHRPCERTFCRANSLIRGFQATAFFCHRAILISWLAMELYPRKSFNRALAWLILHRKVFGSWKFSRVDPRRCVVWQRRDSGGGQNEFGMLHVESLKLKFFPAHAISWWMQWNKALNVVYVPSRRLTNILWEIVNGTSVTNCN